MDIWKQILLSIMAGILVNEVVTLSPLISEVIIKIACSKILPASKAERYTVEFLSHLEEVRGGPACKVFFAFGSIIICLNIRRVIFDQFSSSESTYIADELSSNDNITTRLEGRLKIKKSWFNNNFLVKGSLKHITRYQNGKVIEDKIENIPWKSNSAKLSDDCRKLTIQYSIVIGGEEIPGTIVIGKNSNDQLSGELNRSPIQKAMFKVSRSQDKSKSRLLPAVKRWLLNLLQMKL